MPHYATLLKRGAPFAKSFAVRADSYAESQARVVFYRDGRIIHQIPRAYVHAIETYDTALAAADRLSEHRRSSAGGATIHVRETGGPAPRQRRAIPGASSHTRPPPATSLPAEGISFNVHE